MSLLDELAKVEVACLGDQREKTAYINYLTYLGKVHQRDHSRKRSGGAAPKSIC